MGNRADRARVGRDVLAVEAVAARRGGLEESVPVDQLEADAVDLGLDAVGALVLVLEVAVERVHPLAELLLGRRRCSARASGVGCSKGSKPSATAPGTRCVGLPGSSRSGQARLEGHQLPVELVVLGVRERRAGPGRSTRDPPRGSSRRSSSSRPRAWERDVLRGMDGDGTRPPALPAGAGRRTIVPPPPGPLGRSSGGCGSPRTTPRALRPVPPPDDLLRLPCDRDRGDDVSRLPDPAVLPLRPRGRGAADSASTTEPVVTVQLPLFNERFVVERLLETRLRVRLAARQARDPGPRRQHRRHGRDRGPQGRGAAGPGFDVRHIHRADRVGLQGRRPAARRCRRRGATTWPIFDADFVPNPDFLRRTVDYFTDPRSDSCRGAGTT